MGVVIEKNFWPVLSMVLAFGLFYVTTVAGQQAEVKTFNHENKNIGAHPAIETTVALNATAIALTKSSVVNLKETTDEIKKELADLKRAQLDSIVILNRIEAKIPPK